MSEWRPEGSRPLPTPSVSKSVSRTGSSVGFVVQANSPPVREEVALKALEGSGLEPPQRIEISPSWNKRCISPVSTEVSSADLMASPPRLEAPLREQPQRPLLNERRAEPAPAWAWRRFGSPEAASQRHEMPTMSPMSSPPCPIRHATAARAYPASVSVKNVLVAQQPMRTSNSRLAHANYPNPFGQPPPAPIRLAQASLQCHCSLASLPPARVSLFTQSPALAQAMSPLPERRRTYISSTSPVRFAASTAYPQGFTPVVLHQTASHFPSGPTKWVQHPTRFASSENTFTL